MNDIFEGTIFEIRLLYLTFVIPELSKKNVYQWYLVNFHEMELVAVSYIDRLQLAK